MWGNQNLKFFPCDVYLGTGLWYILVSFQFFQILCRSLILIPEYRILTPISFLYIRIYACRLCLSSMGGSRVLRYKGGEWDVMLGRRRNNFVRLGIKLFWLLNRFFTWKFPFFCFHGAQTQVSILLLLFTNRLQSNTSLVQSSNVLFIVIDECAVGTRVLVHITASGDPYAVQKI